MPQPHFSVVIPLHNQPRLIERSVGSVLAQSKAVHEIIVVDDGSSDDSAAVAQRLAAHATVPVHVLPTLGAAQGAAAARNRGVHAATGDWVAFLDADDAWQADHLAALVQGLATVPDAGVAFSGYDMVFPQSTQVRHMAPPLKDTGVQRVDFTTFLQSWVQGNDCPIWTGAAAFRRQLLLQAGLFPEHCRRGEDKDLWLRAMADNVAAFVPQPSALYYRDMPASLSSVADTRGVPCILATLAALSDRHPAAAPWLQKLHDAEVYLYAWMSWRRGLPLSRDVSVGFGSSPGRWFKLQAMRIVPRSLIQRLRGRAEASA